MAAAHSRGLVHICSPFQMQIRSEFLAEFAPENGPEDAQDPSAIWMAAAPEVCEPASLRAGHDLLSCELDAGNPYSIPISVNPA